MPGRQAKVLSTDHIDDLLFFADHTRLPLRNRLIVLLSIKVDLRAGEIAKLTWDMIMSAPCNATLRMRHMIPTGSRFRVRPHFFISKLDGDTQ